VTAAARAIAQAVAGLALALAACAPEPAPMAPTLGAATVAKAATSAQADPGRAPHVVVCSRTDRAVHPGAPAGQVMRVELRGTDDGALCQRLGSLADTTIDGPTVDSDIRALFASGAVRDVTVVRETDAAAGLVLAYELEPRARLHEVRTEGVSSAEALEIVAALRASRPAWIDEQWVLDAVDALGKAYRDSGFRHASVTHRVEPTTEAAANVVLTAIEGPKVRVTGIGFEGLHVLEPRALQAALATAAGSPVSDAALERDALVIAAAGYDRGLVMIRVEPAQVVESAAGDAATVSFRVEEGPVYRLGKVQVAGGPALSPEESREALKGLVSGGTFSRKVVLEVITRLQATYAKRGWRVEITPETQVDAAHKRIDVVLRAQALHGAAGMPG
jgi:outer membrane protein insertion porin family